MWNALFSTITAITCLFLVIKTFPTEQKGIKITTITALGLWGLSITFDRIGSSHVELVITLLKSISLSLLLVLFLIFVRERKPAIFRYPMGMTIIPLTIPIVYLFVHDIEIMNRVIFMSVQGASILIFALLGITYFKLIENKWLLLIGVISLIWGFLFFWVLQNHFTVFSWAWGLSNSIGMICSVYSFSGLLQKLNPEEL